MTREEVDDAHRARRVLQGEDLHVLLVDPAPPDLRIREAAGVDRRRRAETQPPEHVDRPARLLRLEVDHEIDVDRQAGMTVEHDREPADQDERTAGSLSSANNGSRKDTGRFSIGWRRRPRAPEP